MAEVRWTAKLPTLLVGLVLGAGGLVALGWQKSRAMTLAGGMLVLLGTGFVAYSSTIKNWCEVYAPSDFDASFDQASFSQCLQHKSWWQF